MKIFISTMQDIKETFMLFLLIQQHGKRTMAYKGRHLWNQLPKYLKETDDTLLFKTKLKDQFFKMYD